MHQQIFYEYFFLTGLASDVQLCEERNCSILLGLEKINTDANKIISNCKKWFTENKKMASENKLSTYFLDSLRMNREGFTEAVPFKQKPEL